MSNQGGTGGEGRDNYRLIDEMLNQMKGNEGGISSFVSNNQSTDATFFKVSGYISRIMYDEQRMMYYLACPDCKKKVLEENAGFKCENCGKIYNQANPTYVVSAKLNDLSGSIYPSFMGETADIIMGCNALTFKDMKENKYNTEELREFLQ